MVEHPEAGRHVHRTADVPAVHLEPIQRTAAGISVGEGGAENLIIAFFETLQVLQVVLHFGLDDLQRVQEELLGPDHADALDGEDVLLSFLAQLEGLVELVRPQTLSAHGAVVDVFDLDFLLLLALLHAEHALRTQRGQLVRVFSFDRLLEGDGRQQAVVGRGDWRPLGVDSPDVLGAEQLDFDFLCEPRLPGSL